MTRDGWKAPDRLFSFKTEWTLFSPYGPLEVGEGRFAGVRVCYVVLLVEFSRCFGGVRVGTETKESRREVGRRKLPGPSSREEIRRDLLRFQGEITRFQMREGRGAGSKRVTRVQRGCLGRFCNTRDTGRPVVLGYVEEKGGGRRGSVVPGRGRDRPAEGDQSGTQYVVVRRVPSPTGGTGNDTPCLPNRSTLRDGRRYPLVRPP